MINNNMIRIFHSDYVFKKLFERVAASTIASVTAAEKPMWATWPAYNSSNDYSVIIITWAIIFFYSLCLCVCECVMFIFLLFFSLKINNANLPNSQWWTKRNKNQQHSKQKKREMVNLKRKTN